MDLAELIKHPELLDKETLYDLRSLLALYPYYQTARLLLLQNLYLLHDPSFDEELRRSAIYITDRKVLFNLVEAAHYKLAAVNKTEKATAKADADGDRTISLIDNFLDSIPADQEEDKATKRKPTPADATIDYVSYLLETESEGDGDSQQSPQLKGHDLIDNFIFNEGGKSNLKKNLNIYQISMKAMTTTQKRAKMDILQKLWLKFISNKAIIQRHLKLLVN